MKIFYFTAIACLLTVVTTVRTQAQNPEVPTFRAGKANQPIIGIGVAIPLRRLFGNGKRVKPLPKQPESASSQLIDQFAEPVGIAKPAKSSSQKPENSFEFKPDNRKDVPALPFLNVDLEEVRITAKRYELTPIVITWSQPKSMDGSPSGGGGGGGGGSVGATAPSEIIKTELPDANVCEVVYLLNTSEPVINAAIMYRNIGDVTSRIIQRFPDFTDSDTTALNAVKHAMFVAFNACGIGSTHAAMMAGLHEYCYPVPAERQQATDMDMFNNSAGITIFGEVGCNSRDGLAEAVFRAFDAGRLHKINGEPTP